MFVVRFARALIPLCRLQARHVHEAKGISSNLIAVIGAGKMAEAIIGGALRSGTISPSQIIVSDINKERLGILKETFNIAVAHDNVVAVSEADTVILAVKPQTMPHLMPVVYNRFQPNALIISIVAGFTIQDIASGTGVRSVGCLLVDTFSCALLS
jgi:pyrroline-5-carboxylate reductase